MQQFHAVAEAIIRQVEDEHRDLFGVVRFKAEDGDTSRGRPTEINWDPHWIQGETPPAFPDKDRLIVIEGKQLDLFRFGVFKLTMEHMSDSATGDIQFLDCLDWLLDEDTGGFTFIECCLSTAVAGDELVPVGTPDGERLEPEAARSWLLYQNRVRIRELKKKAKEGAFDSFFRML